MCEPYTYDGDYNTVVGQRVGGGEQVHVPYVVWARNTDVYTLCSRQGKLQLTPVKL
jgi:hypothetical protein